MVNSGSFAPPLTDELLDSYQAMVIGLTGDVGKELQRLLAVCREWWNLPESSDAGSRPHPCGTGIHNPLDDMQAKVLAKCVPSPLQLRFVGNLFDSITDTPLRNCAFHLLWHVTELSLGREPITRDKI